MPASLHVTHIDRAHVVGISSGELDVQFVEVYGLARS
jgi:hypothetical protein